MLIALALGRLPPFAVLSRPLVVFLIVVGALVAVLVRLARVGLPWLGLAAAIAFPLVFVGMMLGLDLAAPLEEGPKGPLRTLAIGGYVGLVFFSVGALLAIIASLAARLAPFTADQLTRTATYPLAVGLLTALLSVAIFALLTGL